jgi:RNA polymerase nonessential primary-like sigma factor
MRNEASLRAGAELVLDRAHDYISRALRFDYLSHGTARQYERVATGGGGAAAGVLTRQSRSSRERDLLARYLEDIATRRKLSSSEEYRLASAARAGDSGARQRLIEHQLRLVVMMARRYRDKGLPLLDLIEEGNIGLMIAIEKFDPERGHRFSTYAKWWIRQSIELALMTQSRVVHVPVHVTRALKRQARQSRGAQDGAILKDITQCLLYDASSPGESALHPTDSDAESLIERMPAPEHEQPDWHVQQATQRRDLLSALALLSPNERLVIEARFGLPDDQTRTLENIAAQLRLSSERVRQIQKAALEKLRTTLGCWSAVS